MIGIIGGSGLYQIDGLTEPVWTRVTTAWGDPSDDILTGTVGGAAVAFLPRHGRGHRIPPTDVNFRANIAALKQLGVSQVISLSAVGSLKAELPPGTFVIVDQFVDRTFARSKTFFGPGLVGHVSAADPVCSRMGAELEAAGRAVGLELVRGGTYLVMEGPQFSTRAESELYRSWGMSVVGMTNMPEAKLAREAELCYATVAMVTDYDCWYPEHGNVSVDQVVTVMAQNGEAARRLVAAAIPRLSSRPGRCPNRCDRALDGAIMTAPAARDPDLVARLRPIAGRVL